MLKEYDMALYRCYYHIVWATKNRVPLITPRIEETLHPYIHEKSLEFKAPIHAVNSMPDHIHLAVTVPPSLSLADWVQSIKGASSHEINAIHTNLPERFAWQRSYSVFTFGQRSLTDIIDYIIHQKEHHRNRTTIEFYEQLPDSDLPH